MAIQCVYLCLWANIDWKVSLCKQDWHLLMYVLLTEAKGKIFLRALSPCILHWFVVLFISLVSVIWTKFPYEYFSWLKISFEIFTIPIEVGYFVWVLIFFFSILKYMLLALTCANLFSSLHLWISWDGWKQT